MNAGGETADQVVRMSLQGIEVAANIALKARGMTAKSLAATLYAILTDKKKVKGKSRLNSLLKSSKELKVFAIRHEDSIDVPPVALPNSPNLCCSQRKNKRAKENLDSMIFSSYNRFLYLFTQFQNHL